jgi:VIT1/CCC1 family predicted Fe2+/Mn2+ transporter
MSEEQRERRSLAALLVGGAVGVAAFVFLVGAGVLLYQRVYGDSAVALVVILLVFGGLGAYLAWLVGVLVFSVLRRGEEERG